MELASTYAAPATNNSTDLALVNPDIIATKAVVETPITANRGALSTTELQTNTGTMRRMIINRPSTARASRIVSRSEGMKMFGSSERSAQRL
jgi:hypothetical protein